MTATKLKDPNARLDYRMNWADPVKGPWLAAGEEIVASTWIVPAGLTVDDKSNDATTATVWLTGGTIGQTYSIINRIETNQQRIDERSMRIHVTDR